MGLESLQQNTAVETAIDFESAEGFERERRFGAAYESLVRSFEGEDTSIEDATETLDGGDRVRFLEWREAARRNFEENERRFNDGSFTARKLLEQNISFGDDEVNLLDTDAYRLEKLSSGMYAVHMESGMFNKLGFGGQALAVKQKDGVSYVILEEYLDDGHREYQERQLRENMPHETHHILWDYLVREGLIENGESDGDFAAAYRVYQDELLARLASGGGLAGYHHINYLKPEEKARLLEERGAVAEKIIETVGRLNGFAIELEESLAASDIHKTDLVRIVSLARTFGELESNLLKAKAVSDARRIQTIEPPRSATGFDDPV